MEVSPHELAFKAASDETQVESLHIRNITDEVIIFKVKTTAPRTYCVKPNAAQASPGETVSIQISRTFKADGGEQSRDKFLVVSTPVGQDLLAQKLDIHRLWEQIEKSNHTFNQEKIKVVLKEDHKQPAPAATSEAAAGTGSHAASKPSKPESTPSLEPAAVVSTNHGKAVNVPDEQPSSPNETRSSAGSDSKADDEANSSTRSSKGARGKISSFLSKKKSVIKDKSPLSSSTRDRSQSHSSSKESPQKSTKPLPEGPLTSPPAEPAKVHTSSEPAVARQIVAPPGPTVKNPDIRTTGGSDRTTGSTDPATAGAAPRTITDNKIVEKKPVKPSPGALAEGSVNPTQTGSADPQVPIKPRESKVEEPVSSSPPTEKEKPNQANQAKVELPDKQSSPPSHVLASTTAHFGKPPSSEPAGVPLHIVFYIALIAFLCGYLLF